jgi:hypothetical protein
MDKKQFLDLVAAEVRGEAADGVSTFLREPENLRKWKDALVSLKVDVEEQYARRKLRMDEVHGECLKQTDGRPEYFDAKREYLGWKAGAGAFKKNVEMRIREVRSLLQGEAQSDTAFKAMMWRLINGAEQLIPREHMWHNDLAELRSMTKRREEQ